MSDRNVLAISYAKRALEAGSREQKRLVAAGAKLDRLVLVVFTRAQDGLPTEFHQDNVSIYGTSASSKLSMLRAAYRLAKQVVAADRSQSWVVSSQDPFESSVIGRLVARAQNASHHIQIHGDFFGNKQWLRSSPLNYVRQYYGLYALRRACGIRVVSTRIKKTLMAHQIAAETITVLPVQVSLDAFLAVGQQRTYATKQPTRYIFVGRLAPEKNLTMLLQAFAAAHRKQPGITLTLVGDGPERDRLVELAEELGVTDAVTYIAWTEDVPKVLAAADVCVLSSDHEGYALVLLEAMAAGLAVVTTDVGCVGELVQSEIHGLVVPVNDQAAYSVALQSLSLSPQLIEQYGRAGLVAMQTHAAQQQTYWQRWTDTFFT